MTSTARAFFRVHGQSEVFNDVLYSKTHWNGKMAITV